MSRSKKVEETVEDVETQDTIEVEEASVLTATEEVKEVAKKEAVTYLGPTIPNVVVHGTVFVEGNLTNIMSEKLEKVPVLKGLLIKTSKLVQAKKELRNKESALSAVYRKAEAEVAKNE